MSKLRHKPIEEADGVPVVEWENSRSQSRSSNSKVKTHFSRLRINKGRNLASFPVTRTCAVAHREDESTPTGQGGNAGGTEEDNNSERGGTRPRTMVKTEVP